MNHTLCFCWCKNRFEYYVVPNYRKLLNFYENNTFGIYNNTLKNAIILKIQNKKKTKLNIRLQSKKYPT